MILQIGLLLLKYSGYDDFSERLGDILRLLKRLSEQDTAPEYLETILRYVTGSAERLTATELTQVVRNLLEEGEKLMPTIAEQWLEQGRQEGRGSIFVVGIDGSFGFRGGRPK